MMKSCQFWKKFPKLHKLRNFTTNVRVCSNTERVNADKGSTNTVNGGGQLRRQVEMYGPLDENKRKVLAALFDTVDRQRDLALKIKDVEVYLRTLKVQTDLGAPLPTITSTVREHEALYKQYEEEGKKFDQLCEELEALGKESVRSIRATVAFLKFVAASAVVATVEVCRRVFMRLFKHK